MSSIFNAGNMPICEGCDHERVELIDTHGEVFYCDLGQKTDSSSCDRFGRYAQAKRVATAVGRALDMIPADDDDQIYEKCRLTDRVADALADYFPAEWNMDLTYELQVPGALGMKEHKEAHR